MEQYCDERCSYFKCKNTDGTVDCYFFWDNVPPYLCNRMELEDERFHFTS